ncbi:hypothetical protein MesoLj113b_01530 [Mesorhizobium sp. 113-3-3]|nr:hypothetical protein MesoLj113b_01530 [Mesorhizobium sp. 113-3-3]
MISLTLPLWGGSTRSVGVGAVRQVGAITLTRGFAATSPIEGEVKRRANFAILARFVAEDDFDKTGNRLTVR